MVNILREIVGVVATVAVLVLVVVGGVETFPILLVLLAGVGWWGLS